MESPALSKKRALERIFVFQAVENGQLTVEQLKECIDTQEERGGGNLLTICKEKGYLTSSQVKQLMSKRLDANAARAVVDILSPRQEKSEQLIQVSDVDVSEDGTTQVPSMMAAEEKQDYERLLAEKDKLLAREQKQREFLKRKLDDYVMKLTTHEEEKHILVEQKQREIETLESELTCYKGLHQQSEENSNTLQEEFEEVRKLLEREKHKSRGLFNLVDESGKELTISEESKRTAETELEKEKKELEYVLGKLEKESNERQKWKKSCEESEEVRLKLANKLKKLEEEQEGSEEAKRTLWENLEKLENEKIKLEENLNELKKDFQNQRKHTHDMEVQLREVSQLPQEVEENQAKLEEEVEQKGKLLEEIEQQVAKENKLRKEIDDFAEQLKSVQEEKEQASKKLQEETEKLNKKIEEINQEKESLSEKLLQETRQLKNQFEQQKAEMEESFHQQQVVIETDLSQYRHKSEDLEAKLQQYQRSLTEWDELDKEKQASKKLLEQEREKNKKLEQARFVLERQLKESEELMKRFQQIYVDGELETGITLQGSNGEFYTIQKMLGRGGMGIAYSALRGSDENIVVIKTLLPDAMADLKVLMRFVQEARTILSFDHENLVGGFDFHQGRELCYFVMEFLDGDSVEDMLDEQAFLDVIEATKIVLGVARALEYLERNSLVHRDVKPANILYTNAGVAKLVDFGIVKMTDRTCSLTTEGIILGTPYYLSPEQTYQTDVDIRSDIYSLGATYYHMVVGEVPFPGDNPIDVIQKRLVKSPRPGKVKPDLPRSVCNIIEKMMNKKAQKRHTSAADLVIEMESVLKKIS